ncbi:beta-1,3-N-acetylglucosaminyltransferase manic fringe-like isoform X2 [Paramacrobiotus metropolitanus]|uniref:beta-1,3-N-acetylglucosaminyltransferase manic fringe-like isoform X2 n=1 Tax=Paramacrobiotus metropolitanus TaxID=2943436 RepID=UPI0024462488|nr:beta-1,3-N-acetylglucosaminyltransferase manic fringe-like isoform X2 [Paramacrobiotus metropolitanus]
MYQGGKHRISHDDTVVQKYYKIGWRNGSLLPKTVKTLLLCATLFCIILLLIRTFRPYHKHLSGLLYVVIAQDGQYSLRNSDQSNFALYLSIRTSFQFHRKRLLPLLQTWIPLALIMKDNEGRLVVPQFTIVTDEKPDNQFIDDAFGTNASSKLAIVYSDCETIHGGVALACKTNQEFLEFYDFSASNPMPKWFCHFDDDAYVNVDILYASLLNITSQNWGNHTHFYVGKRSLEYGYNISDLVRNHKRILGAQFSNGDFFCLNDAMMQRMKSSMMEESDPLNFMNLSAAYNSDYEDFLNDDVLLGYLLTGLGSPE